MHFSTNLEQLTCKIKKIFSEDLISRHALESGFVRRCTNRIKPSSFLTLMVAHMTTNSLCSLSGMTDILVSINGSLKITSQALSQRLNSVFAVRFLRRCYSSLLATSSHNTVNSLKKKGLLKDFNRVFLEDSTSCKLDEKLAGSYKGCGGSARKAGYKVHLIWNSTIGNIHSLCITPSCVTDQAMAKQILKTLGQDDLVLRDLAYFSIPIFKRINKLRAFFLSRLKRQVNVYTLEGKRIEHLPKYLNKHFSNQSVIEFEVLLGQKEQMRVRLVAYRVPESVLNQRMRKQKDVARKHRTAIAKDSKNWCKFTFFITNLPKELYQAETLGILYKLRWEIELVFKSWKSLTSIDLIKGQSKMRVECFILSRLIAIHLMTGFFSYCKGYIEGEYSRELSLYKFISWILRNERLSLLLNRPLEFERELASILERTPFELCKQRRSRQTTKELLQNSCTIEELYPKISENEVFMEIA